MELLKKCFSEVLFDIMGLKDEYDGGSDQKVMGKLSEVMELVLDLRQRARTTKDWGTSDRIRDTLNDAGILVKDSKEGSSWSFK